MCKMLILIYSGDSLLLDQLLPPLHHDGAGGVHHLRGHLLHCYCGQWTGYPTLAKVKTVKIMLSVKIIASDSGH